MKTDFKKTLDCYRPGRPGEFRELEVPPLSYLAIDGQGDPNTAPAFTAALEALYPLAYSLKSASRKRFDRDYVVMPLEGLWSAADLASFTTARDKSRWHWTLLMMVPEWISDGMLNEARTAVAAKTPSVERSVGAASTLDAVRLQTLDEGPSVQTMHVGAFDDEAEVLRDLHEEVIPGLGATPGGPHHEIYLSDARKIEPARRRTLLRQPITRP
jgi:hypothetical protein